METHKNHIISAFCSKYSRIIVLTCGIISCSPLVLGFCLSSGISPYDSRQNDSINAVQIEQATPKEDAKVLFDKGVVYENSGDYTNAIIYYRKAAEQGHAEAQYNLGVMYANGRGVAQDYVEALNWYHKSAAQGLANAQYNLGVMYYIGQAVAQNHSIAALLFHEAAKRGHAKAQYNLGAMYEGGEGITQDYAEAVKWYRKAADQGLAPAQFNLGVMYANGQGVAQDYAEARKWFELAAKQGDTYAIKALQELF